MAATRPKELEELIDSTVTIPTVPTTLIEINRIFSDPDGSAREAAEVIVKDPAIATRVLRLANSSFYGMRNPVNSIQLAVSILGLRVLKNLVVQATVLKEMSAGGNRGSFSPAWLWDHSFKVACATRELCTSAALDVTLAPDEAYTCGLLHDVGKILLFKEQSERFGQALDLSVERQVPLSLAETEVFGFSHAQVGAFLCERWKLSEKIASAVLHHHSPEESEVGGLIAAANALAHMAASSPAGYFASPLDEQWRSELGLSEEHVATILRKVGEASMET